jgi:hypothetical protein
LSEFFVFLSLFFPPAPGSPPIPSQSASLFPQITHPYTLKSTSLANNQYSAPEPILLHEVSAGFYFVSLLFGVFLFAVCWGLTQDLTSARQALYTLPQPSAGFVCLFVCFCLSFKHAYLMMVAVPPGINPHARQEGGNTGFFLVFYNFFK